MKVNEELLKKIAKKSTAFVLVGTLLAGSSPIFLETGQQLGFEVSAQEIEHEEMLNLTAQMGINLYMDDKGFIPTDVYGNETYPFIYEGTTYVPIRAIANLFNANVEWDEKTKMVSITTTGHQSTLEHTPRQKHELGTVNFVAQKGIQLYVNNQLVTPTDVNGNIKDIYIVNGTTYVPVRAVSNALGLPIVWSDVTNSIFIGKHKTEGLTVENINDPETFKQAAEAYYRGASGMCRGSKIDENGQKDYVILSTWVINYFMVCMLNKEYINDDLYKAIFSEKSENNFANLPYVYLAMIDEIYKNSDDKIEHIFDWHSVLINSDYAEFLTNVQSAVYQGRITGNYEVLKKIVNDYFYGTGDGLHLGNSNALIDIVVARAVLVLKLHATSSKEYRECYYLSQAKDEAIRSEIESVRSIVYSKEYVKTQ